MNSLKSIFWNTDRKTEEEKNFVLSKARDVSVCAFQGNVANDIYNRVLETDAQDWQHVCLQVKSHVAVYVNRTPHVPLPALKHK